MKKILIISLIMFLLVGCSNNAVTDNVQTDKKEESKTLIIKTEVTNLESNDGKYLVFLLPEGVKEREPGKATQSGYLGPYETDSDGKVEIPMSYNRDLEYYLDQTNDSKLQVIVTTTEDIYLRNPLNKETYVSFVKNENEEDNLEYPYLSNQSIVEIKIYDKYPDNVYSLTFPDATFVIKLNFKDGYVPKNSFVVSIYKNDSKSTDGIGIYRLGKIARSFQYWDTPFFETDKLSSWDGTIIVENYDTNERVIYDEYPKQVTFDDSGKCEQGNIVNITISN